MNVTSFVAILVIMLLVATGVAIGTRWLRIPYVTGLVVAGLAITRLLPEQVGLDDSLILNLFLPILIFEASINTDISRLRNTIKPIALLAGPGVILCSGVTAFLLWRGLGVGAIAALFMGVILAITDTVSVIAVFKEVPVPARLSTIVEGESLFNDGIALVLFGLLLKVQETGSVTFLDACQDFFVVIVGGSLIGLALGYLGAGLLARIDEPLGNILLTIALALGVFQIGHELKVSGVVAVVVAGLMVNKLGIGGNISASTRLNLLSFWEVASFGVNSFIFLLIGIEVDLITFWQTLPAVLFAILAYQIGRILSVYPILAIARYLDRPIPRKWQHVLFFGNIKGSLSMALALSLPATLPERGQAIAIVFGTVLLSLVGQGLSLPWVVKRLELSRLSPSRLTIEELQARLMGAKAALDELETLFQSGVLPKAIYEETRSDYQVRVASAEKSLREFYNRRPSRGDKVETSFTRSASIRRRLLLAEKGALAEAVRQRVLSEEVVAEKLRAIDEQLLALEDD